MEEAPAAAQRLRHALVDHLVAEGSVRTPGVEAALRAVPRHVFIPAVSLQRAYANDVVSTKRDERSGAISAASQPSIVALMLEQLGVRPGERVLEIGAGTGYNAALLAHLAGPRGQVTTIDVDPDITAAARSALAAAGYPGVAVIDGDGALGWPPGAPYDRLIATVGAWDLPQAWVAQLAPAGRLVVPLRLRGAVTRSIAFERAAASPGTASPGAPGEAASWRSISSRPCSFMPLRGGIADDPRRDLPLTPDGSVTLALYQDQQVDEAALARALTWPRAERWSGVMLAATSLERVEWLSLWLTCALHAPLTRMTARREAIDARVVLPMFTWGAMATAEAASLAYLTSRDADGGRRELGVIGHGPNGGALAREVAAQARAWDRRYRDAAARFTLQPVAGPGPATSPFTLRTPHAWLSVDWSSS